MTSSEIQFYWNERARANPSSATTNDIWLRELETRTLAAEIRKLEPATVLDLGCGDGATTIRLALQFSSVQFIGIDYSPSMLELAARATELHRARGHRLSNLRLIEGDVTRDSLPEHDLSISCRCLINLATHEDQDALLDRLSFKPFRLIENFKPPHDNLNLLRIRCGLKPIDIQPQNLYLTRTASTISFADSYYFATRIIYAAECAASNEKPDYLHDRHRLAIELPNVAKLNCAPMRMLQ